MSRSVAGVTFLLFLDLGAPLAASGSQQPEGPANPLFTETKVKNYLPHMSWKKASTREMTATGVFTTGDPGKATAERGKKDADPFIEAAVKFIEAWKKISQ